jgi:hypothetical protein
MPGEVYAMVRDQLVHSAILHGGEYNMNNGLVHDLLQSLTLNGPAWSWVNAYQRNRDYHILLRGHDVNKVTAGV